MTARPGKPALRAAVTSCALLWGHAVLAQEATPEVGVTAEVEPAPAGQADQASRADTEQAGAALATQETETSTEPEPLETGPSSVSLDTSGQADAMQAAALRAKLASVNEERADSSTLLPWLTLATGIAAVAVGTTIGIVRTLDCDDSCTSPFWPSWLLVGGTAVSTGGLVWLQLAREDQAELDSRRYHLERQLEGYERERAVAPKGIVAQLRVQGRW